MSSSSPSKQQEQQHELACGCSPVAACENHEQLNWGGTAAPLIQRNPAPGVPGGDPVRFTRPPSPAAQAFADYVRRAHLAPPSGELLFVRTADGGMYFSPVGVGLAPAAMHPVPARWRNGSIADEIVALPAPMFQEPPTYSELNRSVRVCPPQIDVANVPDDDAVGAAECYSSSFFH